MKAPTPENLMAENLQLKARVAALEKIELAYQNTEKELRKSEEKFRTIFENTGTACCIIEEDATIANANARFAQISGYTIEELVGKKSWTEFVVEEDLARMLTQHRLRRLSRDVALRSYEFRFLNKNKEVDKHAAGDRHDSQHQSKHCLLARHHRAQAVGSGNPGKQAAVQSPVRSGSRWHTRGCKQW